ncbi:MAG: APC family permease [Vicinamibacterales bacterium]
MAGPTLARTLSLGDLIVYGLLFIGPLAPVGVFGVLDARTGGAVALVYLLATAAMACTAWSYAEMSRVVPHAGSVFAYATEGLGRPAGFVAGWMAMLDYLLIPAVAYLFSGIALHALMPSVPVWAFTVAAFAGTTLLNLAGVAIAARVGLVVLVAEVAVLALFVVLGVAVLLTTGPARPLLSPFVGTGALTASAVAGAMAVAVLSFLGFDAIAGFAEENAGGPDQVGRAILVCLATAGVLFVLQAWLAAVLSPQDPAGLAGDPARQGTEFYDVTRAAVAPWLATVLAITKAVGPAFAAMTAQAASARLLFGMARDGRLPRILARIDGRHGMPRVALVTSAALTFAVALWAARRADGLDVLVSMVDIGALAAFTLLHASVVGYFVVRRTAPGGARHAIVPLAGAAVTLWVIAGASPLAQAVGAAWLIAGLAMFAVTRTPTDPPRAA